MKGLRLYVVLVFAGMFFGAFAQQKYTLSGTITDAETGEDLAGAVISLQNTSYNAVGNPYGFYSLTIPEGDYQIVVQFVGYQDYFTEIKLHSNQSINFKMQSVSFELDRIDVKGSQSGQNIGSPGMGNVKINPKQIENIPVLLGERDLLKTFQLMPGVQASGEGNTGFYVRGGGADQNLILLDEAPVYNPSHLLGFFSVFNSEAVRDAELFKGHIPAEYGGRASSVLDIRMKEGNSKEFQTTGNIGLISSSASVEGPFKSEVGSFIVSARRTYADLFLKFVPDEDINQTDLYFYDLNLKTNFRINASNRLFVSAYLGRDKFFMHDQFGFNWGSKTATVRLNHTCNEKLFSNTSVIYSNYSYQIDMSGDNNVLLGSVVQDVNLKQDYSWYLSSNNTVRFGANLIFHKFVPGEVEASPNSVYKSLAVRPRHALEYSVYMSNNQRITNRLKIYYGLRLALFSNVGPGDFYTFNNSGNLLKTNSYDHFTFIKTQGGQEPRLAIDYSLNEREALKASYNRIHQFIHLLSNSTASTPTDVWLPSSNNVKPQIADQFSLGYFRKSDGSRYESSVEVYYKNLQNQIDYRNGADLVFNSTVEAELIFGRGWAYGSEFLFRKNEGKLTGWIGYTLAKTMRQFDQINDGKAFPARQDRRHDVSVVAMYDLGRKLKFSATWVFHSGNAVTFPNGKYEIDGKIVGYYTERNGYRMPDYHRLDCGLTWIRRQTEKFESSWNFSVFNAYGRENAYFISFRQNKENPELNEAVQISLFKVIPSISYKFKF